MKFSFLGVLNARLVVFSAGSSKLALMVARCDDSKFRKFDETLGIKNSEKHKGILTLYAICTSPYEVDHRDREYLC